MEVKIGVRNVAREIVVDSDQTAAAVTKAVETALSKGDAGGVLTLTDNKGRTVVVPAGALGYVEIGEEEVRRVGFGTL